MIPLAVRRSVLAVLLAVLSLPGLYAAHTPWWVNALVGFSAGVASVVVTSGDRP